MVFRSYGTRSDGQYGDFHFNHRNVVQGLWQYATVQAQK